MNKAKSRIGSAGAASAHSQCGYCSRTRCFTLNSVGAVLQLLPTATLWPAQLAVLTAAPTWYHTRSTTYSRTMRRLQYSAVASMPNAWRYSDTYEFQPRLLTHHIQQAQQVEQLQQLWQQHQDQFNAIHFSAMMQQLAVLHHAAEGAQKQQSQDVIRGITAAATAGASSTLQDCVGETGTAHSNVSSSTDSTWGSTQQQQEQGKLVRPRFRRKSWQLQQSKRQQQSAQQLSNAVAASALSPGMCQQLDSRAVVMISHGLAKVGLLDAQLLDRILQIVSQQELLQQLDAQQLTNLVWSVAVCVDSVNGMAGVDMATSEISASSSDGSSALARLTTPSSTTATATVGSAAASRKNSSSDTRMNSRQLSGTYTTPLSRFELPSEWLLAVARAFTDRLPGCSSCGVAMAMWGFAQLGLKPNAKWMKAVFQATAGRLTGFSPNELAVLAYAIGKLQADIPTDWLQEYLSASTESLPSLTTQELSMSLWGLASCRAVPNKAWLMAWFLCSRANMHRASTQDLSMWLYSLALLNITPSPLWCTSYVEASYGRLTAPTIRPQELVNVMWAISCLDWNPPMLYWKGLLDAAKENMKRFNPQDLANCISAAAAVDVSSLERSWLAAFIQASERKLPSFHAVHLAHTASALSVIDRTHAWASVVVHAAWQEAFVQVAEQYMARRRFRLRTLDLVVKAVKQMQFLPKSAQVQEFLQRAQALLEHMKAQQQKDQQ